MTTVRHSLRQQLDNYTARNGRPAAGGWQAQIQPTQFGGPQQSTFEGRPEAIGTLDDLIQVYRASLAYNALGVSTKKSYDLYLRRIAEKFGSLPMFAFDQKGARAAIRRWRDDVLSRRPRTADATIGVFRRLLNLAVDEEYIVRNPAALLGSIHSGTRRDIIWSDEQIAAFLANAPRHLARALLLAVWTGQRQGDLLSLEWKSYDGEYLVFQQRKVARGKSGRRVKILVARELRDVLAEIEHEQITRSQHPDPKKRVPKPKVILTTSVGKPWRQGFKCAWRNAVKSSGVSGVTFHDLRGTFITLAHRAGATIREIAEASGHDERDCETVIRRHYLATGAELVISRLEESHRFTSDAWISRRPKSTKRIDAAERVTGPLKSRALTRFEKIQMTNEARRLARSL